MHSLSYRFPDGSTASTVISGSTPRPDTLGSLAAGNSIMLFVIACGFIAIGVA